VQTVEEEREDHDHDHDHSRRLHGREEAAKDDARWASASASVSEESESE
jgi:hypothetical protein